MGSSPTPSPPLHTQPSLRGNTPFWHYFLASSVVRRLLAVLPTDPSPLTSSSLLLAYGSVLGDCRLGRALTGPVHIFLKAHSLKNPSTQG